jgi:hypothetical protein
MLERVGLGDFRATDVEVLGGEATYGAHSRTRLAREVVLKIAIHHDNREAVEAFVREVPSIALAGPPGVTGGGSGLPRPSPLIRLECFPVDRSQVSPLVEVGDEAVEFEDVDVEELAAVETGPQPETPIAAAPEATVTVPLVAIAHGRSGDKGADVNIGVRARHVDFWPELGREATSERVAEQLAHLGAAHVDRYELPGIQAFNFLLSGGLGAGGTASLRFDPQGKAVAQQLLDMEVEIAVDLADHPALRRV